MATSWQNNGNSSHGLDSRTYSDKPASHIKKEMEITTSLHELQTNEQRQILDTVAQVRKCGLASILQLPQLVVCGDQSAGKSSVLEALTEIPFPRNENLCTRFATEIILRRANTHSLTIKIIPDNQRPSAEQVPIKAFEESITNFDELPRIMDEAMAIMKVDDDDFAHSTPRAFASDVLSIEIEGPSRPQLTLVDIPGLIQTETKGVTKADVGIVAGITDRYIQQGRTICLAVVSGANDHANQMILTKVREVDPRGDRTLGIITKPDRLPANSASESKFIELAKNEDIFFKLGWHVLKNRSFEERDCSLEERNATEITYFRNYNFKVLPAHSLGIDTLRIRLSQLLFEHIKHELPKLRKDLEIALLDSQSQLSKLGEPRTKTAECKAYLSRLSLEFYEVCKAAAAGHYEGNYFEADGNQPFDLTAPTTIRRLRAVVQLTNTEFADNIRLNGHKYQIDSFGKAGSGDRDDLDDEDSSNQGTMKPIKLSRDDALAWVRRILVRTRGRELVGNFNPLLVGELFWEQCSKWESMAVTYLDEVAELCSKFLELLLHDKTPKDVSSRLRASFIEDALKTRYNDALLELQKIITDTRCYPINYNHYYTDTINKRRHERQKASLRNSVEGATTHTHLPGCHSDHTSASVDIDEAFKMHSQRIDPNMENVSSEEALDCLFAIYKVRLISLPL